MNAPTHVYEVVDATDEENYYTMGIVLTEAEALAILDSAEPPNNDNDHDCPTFEVRSRPLGFHPHEWTTIASRTWEQDFTDDDRVWKAHPIKNPLTAHPPRTTG